MCNVEKESRDQNPKQFKGDYKGSIRTVCFCVFTVESERN